MQILPFQMAHLVDRFNTIAMIERFNHVARQRGCDYAGIEVNRAFNVHFISTVEGDQHVLSLMMGIRYASWSFLHITQIYSLRMICTESMKIG
jgi:hypothetical protein